ncbi:class I SAM-dependent methyltransferase [Pleomorphovibrio marinus]|uniref:class I SAM-dependent methyltransferase n=1 Tax=Pleomorphovibrio marinus TaxID=2164132 RepID=UPI0013006638|nr:class I SAM-dependent methyltransferase [Pleomorphovibrio marinus]
MSTNNYDKIAFIYEKLSKVILGKEFVRSKDLFLQNILEDMDVWVIGGGTGAIIPEILIKNGLTGKLVYSEASQKMLQRARKRVSSKDEDRVHFYREERFHWPFASKADIVICQYLLDVLIDQQIHNFFKALEKAINPNTQLIFADFYPHSRKSLFIKAMISAFRCITNHPRKDLPDYDFFFERYGWKTQEEFQIQGGFIRVKCLVKA